jgi:cytochrome c peroxidase
MARLVGTQNGTVGGIQGYRDLFKAAYPQVASFDDLNFGHATRAIAAYVAQTFTATDTPFDRFVAGDASALTPSQQNGMNLFFGQANCSACHSGVHFSDFDHHALAVPQLGPGKDPTTHDDTGLALVTSSSTDNYKFRTPSLRNVALTAPYMHDGCYATLDQVVQHHLNPAAALSSFDPTTLPAPFAATYDADPTRNAARIAALDPLLQTPVSLTPTEVSDVVSFLGALTDSQSLGRAQAGRPSSVPSGLPVD